MRSCHRGESPVLGSLRRMDLNTLRQHRQHRLCNLERLFQSRRRMVWPRLISIVADAADGADGIDVAMGLGFTCKVGLFGIIRSDLAAPSNTQAQAAA